MMLLWGAVALALLVMSVTALVNMFSFPRLRPALPDYEPFVSILVPARNEATVIIATLKALLEQDYQRYEVLLLDDHSTDDTAHLATTTARFSTQFRLLKGDPLPPGWLGKTWACHQLSEAAKGDLLIFTDADVQWSQQSLAAVVALMQVQRADLLSVWSTQRSESWAERLVIPMIALSIIAYLPEILVRRNPSPLFAAANGQCMAFRRDAYTAIGGHTAVRDQIVEDVALARRIKRQGLRLVMADGNRLLTCRMYRGWTAVRDGLAKNILAGHGGSILFLLASTLFHWAVFVAPWVWLVMGGGLFALLLGVIGIQVRMLTAVVTRQRPHDALLMPLSVLLMTVIAAQSILWKLRGRTQWKGRVLGTPNA